MEEDVKPGPESFLDQLLQPVVGMKAQQPCCIPSPDAHLPPADSSAIPPGLSVPTRLQTVPTRETTKASAINTSGENMQ